MSVDHVLNQWHEILWYQIEPARTSTVVDRTIQIVVCSADVHIQVDHGQKLNESRSFVMIVVNDSVSYHMNTGKQIKNK